MITIIDRAISMPVYSEYLPCLTLLYAIVEQSILLEVGQTDFSFTTRVPVFISIRQPKLRMNITKTAGLYFIT